MHLRSEPSHESGSVCAQYERWPTSKRVPPSHRNADVVATGSTAGGGAVDVEEDVATGCGGWMGSTTAAGSEAGLVGPQAAASHTSGTTRGRAFMRERLSNRSLQLKVHS